MLQGKNWLFFMGILVFLLSGCGKTENGETEVSMEGTDSNRAVSFDTRIIWHSGLLIEEGDLKESGVVYEDAPITFQDEVAEEMLRNILGKPEGEVYISDLQEIHAIYWRSSDGRYWSNLQSPDGKLPHVTGCEEGPWEGKHPESLEDFAYCYNLQWMEFSGGNEVPSLKPLYELSQLETLCFTDIVVTEELLEEIGELPALKHLEIEDYLAEYTTNWGEFTDGSFLLPLADRLTFLDAGGGIAWTPNVLAQLTKMEQLRLNYMEDVSFLEHMPELKQLHMYRCTPEDWSSLASLEKLKFLEIWGCDRDIIEIGLEDLKLIKNLDYLEVKFTALSRKYSKEEIAEALPSLTGLVVEY